MDEQVDRAIRVANETSRLALATGEASEFVMETFSL